MAMVQHFMCNVNIFIISNLTRLCFTVTNPEYDLDFALPRKGGDVTLPPRVLNSLTPVPSTPLL